jgi:hypothetical protein
MPEEPYPLLAGENLQPIDMLCRSYPVIAIVAYHTPYIINLYMSIVKYCITFTFFLIYLIQYLVFIKLFFIHFYILY